MDPASKATRAEVEAYAAAHPGESERAIARAFSAVPRSTVRRWLVEWRKRLGAPAPTTTPGPASTKSKPTHVRDMAPDARELVVAGTLDGLVALRGLFKRIRSLVESTPEDELPRVDRDLGQFTVNLQRALSGQVESCPGVLEAVRGADPEAAAAVDDDLEEVLTALGVKPK